ncbi:MAG: hypothetical protein KDK70_09390 [Myxococcales bacterium]|nr:hypothetical protein [Myxococcales bacterium]
MSSEALHRGLGLVLVAAAGLVAGCAGFRRGDYWDEPVETTGSVDDGGGGGGPGPGGSGSSDGGSGTSTGAAPGPSFELDVLPLLRAGCERCHASDGAASNTELLLDLDDPEDLYAEVLGFVDLEAPAQSRLLVKGAGQGHTGGAIYDEHSAEYAAILDWIEQGAQP